MNMRYLRKSLVTLGAAFFISAPAGFAQNGGEAFPPDLEGYLSAGTSAVYNLDFKSAEEQLARAVQIRPDHPAAYFFQLMLIWYRLTYDCLLNRNPPMEKKLLDQAERTIDISKTYIEKSGHPEVGYLYLGGALGAKGWFHVTRNQWVRAYLSGKKGYSNMLKVVELDPEVYDAYLGIGMFEYYAATLGPTLKALASFSIRGDRERALRHLRFAEFKSRFVRLEAAYFQWNAANDEQRYDDAERKAAALTHSFPDSPLFLWCRIKTAFDQKKWDVVMQECERYILRANAGPQREFYLSPYELLMSKVLYHYAVSAWNIRNFRLAKQLLDSVIDQPTEFEGWKSLAYLRRGELFDIEGKRMDAQAKYRAVLKYPDVWDSHKLARQRIRDPYHLND